MAAFFVSLASSGCFHPSADSRPVEQNTSQQITASTNRLSDAIRHRQIQVVRSEAKQLLLENPEDWTTLFRLASAEAEFGDQTRAIELLGRFKVSHPHGGSALAMRADLLLANGRDDLAVSTYRELARAFPNAIVAHRQLAWLLNRLGRRQEAVVHLQQLCRLGDIGQDELASMLSRVDPSSTSPAQQPIARPVNSKRNPVAVSAARKLASERRAVEALGLLQHDLQAATRGDLPVVASLSPSNDSKGTSDPMLCSRDIGVALMGRLAVDLGDQQAIGAWLALVNESQRWLADHWYAISVLTREYLGDPAMAQKLMFQALLRDPTDREAHGIVADYLNELGDYRQEHRVRERSALLKRTVLLGNQIGTTTTTTNELYLEIAQVLDSLGRRLEANAWRVLASSLPGNKQPDMENLKSRYQDLKQKPNAFPLPAEVTGGLAQRNEASALWDQALKRIRKRWSEFGAVETDASTPVAKSDEPQCAFENWADITGHVGVSFKYDNAAIPKGKGLHIFEQFGGGVACLDIDMDGRTDLYFGQGATTPVAPPAKPSPPKFVNQLYRNCGAEFSNITRASSGGVGGYTMGLSVGDINQDGWSDVLVANYGANECLVNQGDGTFQRTDLPGWSNDLNWTSGAAVSDLDGDALPDIVSLSYLNDSRVFEPLKLMPNGQLIDYRGPESYAAGANALLRCTLDGSWSKQPLTADDGLAPSLGIVVGDLHQERGIEIMIANDTKPNRLWLRNACSEQAKLLGCAFSARGGSAASMGVAAADFDANGRIDFYVTNFFREPNHLYMQNNAGSFRDAIIASGMEAAVTPMLGFGTVALDFENDGDLDLVVLNGHIEDLRHRGIPLQMRPQRFRNQGGRFEVVDTNGAAGNHPEASFWNTPAIGRGLATLDLDQDGRLDLVATFQDRPAVLLHNQSPRMPQADIAKPNAPKSQIRKVGNWLRLTLVGTSCERSAVGARITLASDEMEWTHFLTSGHGYACHNESVLTVGVGSAESLKRVDITWSNGRTDRLSDLRVNQSWLVVQGQGGWVYDQ